MQQINLIAGKFCKMLPKDATRVPCSLLLKASPRSLSPDVGKHSKHVCPILRFPGYHAVSRRSQSTWSSRIQQRPQTALRAVRADRVSRRAQQCASQLLTSSEQQLLGDYSTPVTEHTGEHAQSLPLSLFLPLSVTSSSLSIHTILLIFSMATFIKQEQKRSEASHSQDVKTNDQEDKTDCNELQMCQSKPNCGLILISSKV